MLIHYLGFAVRLLRRSRMYAAITIGGLAIALASCLLMSLFVRHELGYDAWLPGVARLYRVHLVLHAPGRQPFETSLALGPIHDRLVGDPDVAASARLRPLTHLALQLDGRVVEVTAFACDPSLFDVLDLPVARGVRALPDPTSALVSETAARTYFGDADPVGKTLAIRGGPVVRIVGVLRDLPPETHVTIGLVLRIDALDTPEEREARASWHNVFGYTYVRLKPGADPAALQHRLETLLATEVPDIDAGATHLAGKDLFHPQLVAVRDVHLHDVGDEPGMRPHGDPTTIYAIAGVGVLLLLIAIGNYLNLATARAGRRAREIAIRKAAGAEPRDIVVQYLGEAVLVALCALVAALVLVELTLPWFEQLAGRDLAGGYDLPLIAVALAATVGLGVISGLYPAIVLARYEPAVVMNQNQASVASGSGRLRAVLVFAQFTASIVLAIGTAVVYRQARYAADAELGFAKRDRLVVRFSDARPDQLRSWLERVRGVPGVVTAALGSDTPGGGSGLNTVVEVPGDAERSGLLRSVYIDDDYFATLGVTPLAGRGFSRAVPSDQATVDAPGHEGAVVLNAAAVRRLGLGVPATAVGRTLQIGMWSKTLRPFRVIGVVPDVHYEPASRVVEPTVFAWHTGWFHETVIQVRPGEGPAVRDALAALWTEMFPEAALHIEGIDAVIDDQYRNERRLAAILTAAALLALAVACLGLYGLSSFITESRRKEIAIRKILGASTADVVRLLAWQLARPVALACAIGAPLAYLASERWLARFAYRISVGGGWIAGAVAAALALAAATVAIQSVRSARATPVDALRAS